MGACHSPTCSNAPTGASTSGRPGTSGNGSRNTCRVVAPRTPAVGDPCASSGPRSSSESMRRSTSRRRFKAGAGRSGSRWLKVGTATCPAWLARGARLSRVRSRMGRAHVSIPTDGAERLPDRCRVTVDPVLGSCWRVASGFDAGCAAERLCPAQPKSTRAAPLRGFARLNQREGCSSVRSTKRASAFGLLNQRREGSPLSRWLTQPRREAPAAASKPIASVSDVLSTYVKRCPETSPRVLLEACVGFDAGCAASRLGPAQPAGGCGFARLNQRRRVRLGPGLRKCPVAPSQLDESNRHSPP